MELRGRSSAVERALIRKSRCVAGEGFAPRDGASSPKSPPKRWAALAQNAGLPHKNNTLVAAASTAASVAARAREIIGALDRRRAIDADAMLGALRTARGAPAVACSLAARWRRCLLCPCCAIAFCLRF